MSWPGAITDKIRAGRTRLDCQPLAVQSQMMISEPPNAPARQPARAAAIVVEQNEIVAIAHPAAHPPTTGGCMVEPV